MSTSPIRGISPLLLLVLLLGCSRTERVGEFKCSDLRKAFFTKPLQEGIAEFSKYDVEKQYAIYICGTQYIHPPMTHLAQPFAMEGESVVPFLKDRLSEATNDVTIQDIVYVFLMMVHRGTYHVAGDQELMSLIEAKVNGMNDPNWKAMTAKHLDEIRG